MSPQEIKEILHNIDFQADSFIQEPHSKTLQILINLVERLSEENEKFKIEIQKLRDENNRLKGEQGKPKIPGKKGSGKGKNVSSEKDRKQREGKEEKPKSKKKNIPINRTEICKVDPSILPADAEYRGYEPVLVQEILITTDNVEYRKEIFLFPFRETHLRRRITARDSWGIRSRDTIAGLHPEICGKHVLQR